MRADLPVLRLTLDEFQRLSEYSCTLPTGTVPGKRWRRLDGVYDKEWRAAGNKPFWMIGEYDPLDDGTGRRIKINWYRPIISVRGIACHRNMK